MKHLRQRALIKSLFVALACSIYIYIIVSLRKADLPTLSFYSAGISYLFIHILKLMFAVYFVVSLYATGHLIVVQVEKIFGAIRFTMLDNFLIKFFSGSAIITTIMFILGYLKLYYEITGIVLTVVPLIFYLWKIGEIPPIEPKCFYRKGCATSLEVVLCSLFSGLNLFVMALILAKFGLMPSDDWDTLTHYQPYYNIVIGNHHIYPNEAWYHFYYSKGSGLLFLGMLLTDKYCPQLLSCMFLFSGMIAVFSLIRGMIKERYICLALTALILTTVLYGEGFSRQHIMMAVGIAMMIWFAVHLFLLDKKSNSEVTVVVLWALNMCGFLLICVPLSFVFVFPFSVVMFILSLVKRFVVTFRLLYILSVASLCTFIILLAINYCITGLAEITPMRVFWSFANQHKMSEWVSLYMMLYLFEGSGPTLGTFAPSALSMKDPVSWLMWIFRIERFAPEPYMTKRIFLILLAFAFLLMLYILSQIRKKGAVDSVVADRNTIYTFMTSVSMVLIAVFISMILPQPASIYRSFTFSIFLVPLTAISIFRIMYNFYHVMLKTWSIRLHVNELAYSYVFVCCKSILLIYCLAVSIFNIYKFARSSKTHPVGVTKVIIGKESYYDYYNHIFNDWHIGRYGNAKTYIGQDKRVLSLGLDYSTGMFPGRDIESEVNYNYREWHAMAFGETQKAKQAFMDEGINYFLVDVRIKDSIFGALPLSPLFSAKTLSEHFRVVWEEDGLYAITWKEDAAGEDERINQLSKTWEVMTSGYQYRSLYERVKYYYMEYQGREFPLYQNKALPPVKGWQ